MSGVIVGRGLKKADARGVLRSWGELLRLPNLLTLPGGTLAGFALWRFSAAGGGALWTRQPGVVVNGSPAPIWWLPLLAVSGAVLLLYCAGLIQNDLADREVDQRERPGRPIPSGRISPGAARLASFFLFAVALLLAYLAGGVALRVALVLVVLISAYNLWLKRHPLAGPLVMGGCRGVSVLAGAAVAGAAGVLQVPVLLAGVLMTVYVSALTIIASREMESDQAAVVYRRRFWPAVGAASFSLLLLTPPGVEMLAGLVRLATPTAGSAWAPVHLVTAALPLAGFLTLVLTATVAAARYGAKIGARAVGPRDDIASGVGQGGAEAVAAGSVGDQVAMEGVPRAVGGWIRVMIPLQAAMVMLGLGGSAAGPSAGDQLVESGAAWSVTALLPSLVMVVGLLALWAVGERLGRIFYGS